MEQIRKYQDREKPDLHIDAEACGGELVRLGIELCRIGKETYQMKAVMGDGSHVAGHFGKDAVRRKRK